MNKADAEFLLGLVLDKMENEVDGSCFTDNRIELLFLPIDRFPDMDRIELRKCQRIGHMLIEDFALACPFEIKKKE